MDQLQIEQEFPLFRRLSQTSKEFLSEQFSHLKFSYQQRRQIIEHAVDLVLWQEEPIEAIYDGLEDSPLKGKQKVKAICHELDRKMEDRCRKGTCYTAELIPGHSRRREIHTLEDGDINLLGSCPCPPEGELTRCCNLLTLDVVRQCGFGCSYCSIQSFYTGQKILFTKDLSERLKTIQLPEGTWHIGTGQSSDSLMWGNEHHVLDALRIFSEEHPEIVVELKTKSSRTDWLKTHTLPKNVVVTFSLNPQVVIDNEEHGTASLHSRLESARKVADAGYLVGFHFHPMIHIDGWKEHYSEVIDRVTSLFDYREVLMISFGTLAFTRPVIRKMREEGPPSKVLQIPLTLFAGKYTYPYDIKRDMFSHAYRSFSESWRSEEDSPFFYLCMEDPELWEPVFGYSYKENTEFEKAMKKAYRSKVDHQLNSFGSIINFVGFCERRGS